MRIARASSKYPNDLTLHDSYTEARAQESEFPCMRMPSNNNLQVEALTQESLAQVKATVYISVQVELSQTTLTDALALETRAQVEAGRPRRVAATTLREPSF